MRTNTHNHEKSSTVKAHGHTVVTVKDIVSFTPEEVVCADGSWFNFKARTGECFARGGLGADKLFMGAGENLVKGKLVRGYGNPIAKPSRRVQEHTVAKLVIDTHAPLTIHAADEGVSHTTVTVDGHPQAVSDLSVVEVNGVLTITSMVPADASPIVVDGGSTISLDDSPIGTKVSFHNNGPILGADDAPKDKGGLSIIVTAPASTAIELTASDSRVDLRDIEGAVNVSSVGRGYISCRNTKDLSVLSQGTGEISIVSAQGSIVLAAEGDADIDCHHGRVDRLTATASSTGNVIFTGEAREVSAGVSADGDISITLCNDDNIVSIAKAPSYTAPIPTGSVTVKRG